MAATHANTYSYIVCDSGNVLQGSDGGGGSPEAGTLEDYAQMLTALIATAAQQVNGRQVRFWVTLLPPTGALPMEVWCACGCIADAHRVAPLRLA